MRILREFELSAYIKLWWFDSIDENLHIQIGDFGLARLRDPFSPLSTGSSSHTHVRWLAPELVAAQSPVSFQSDIYAFGCLWVEVGDVQCV